MAEYIDLNEAIIDFGFEWDDIAPTRDEFINFLKSRKRANVKEIVYGKWIPTKYPFMNECEDCSSCGYRTVWGHRYNYCPNCGAKMDGGNNDGHQN